ncbi:toluene tolerance protein [Pseudomonas sp. phDV1]|nr:MULTISPECIES: lipopolysaccharide kinase InaA family protein [Pseudomonas]AXO60323.1 toluene tolerance protein [Pseudomonas sp. phDV1]TXR40080.1 toluene tolerance protein [Pseudomonas mendocina]
MLNKLTDAELATLIDRAKVLEGDSFGPKVYRLANGNFLKLFRRKRLLSSALLQPYSMRFLGNAKRLHKLGIPTLTPLSGFQLQKPGMTAVLYQPLPGETLKDIYLAAPERLHKLLPELTAFIRKLHRLGIYFRSLHLGNIVLTPEGVLGLIDIADLSIQRRPLSKAKRKRNLAHFERLLKTLENAGDFPFMELSTAVLSDQPASN